MSHNTFPTLVRAAAHNWCSSAASVCRSCKEAVPGCCTQVVSLTSVEAAHIIYTETARVRASLYVLMSQAAREAAVMTDDDARVLASGDLDDMHATMLDLSNRWWPVRMPCAFLARQGRCGIYQSRPSACLTHYLMDGTPAACNNDTIIQQGYLDTATAKRVLAQSAAETNITVGGRKLPLSLHTGLAGAIMLTLWWLHSRRLKPAPSRKQLEILLDHLPPLHIEYEHELSAPEPVDNETLPDGQ